MADKETATRIKVVTPVAALVATKPKVTAPAAPAAAIITNLSTYVPTTAVVALPNKIKTTNPVVGHAVH